MLDVQGDPQFIGIGILEKKALLRMGRICFEGPQVARRIAARFFHLDDVGPQISEKLAAERSLLSG